MLTQRRCQINKPLYDIDVDVRTVPLPKADRYTGSDRLTPAARALPRKRGLSPRWPHLRDWFDQRLTWPDGLAQDRPSFPAVVRRTGFGPRPKSTQLLSAQVPVAWLRRVGVGAGGPVERRSWTIVHNATPPCTNAAVEIGCRTEAGTDTRLVLPPHSNGVRWLHGAASAVGRGDCDTANSTAAPPPPQALWWEDSASVERLVERLCDLPGDRSHHMMPCEGLCPTDGLQPWTERRCRPPTEAHARLFSGCAPPCPLLAHGR